jgi:hypothetical protein
VPCPQHRTALPHCESSECVSALGKDFDLKFERGTSFYREPSGEAAWQTFSTNYGPTKALAGGLDESRRADLRRDFIAFHDGFRTELGICVPRDYLLTVGVRR